MKIATLILAAGNSSRLGQPKQLLIKGKKSLLQHTIDACKQSKADSVHLIVGAGSEEILRNVESSQCMVHEYPFWQDGLSSSIAFGIQTLSEYHYDAVIIVLSDQPYFSVEILDSIIELHLSSNVKIIISKYRQGQGPPTLFHYTLFNDISKLTGDEGARKIVTAYRGNIGTIDFPEGHIDIDTKKDLKHLVD